MTTASTFTSPALARVMRGDLCAGCGACAGMAPGKINMQVAAPGFLRPIQSSVLTAEEEALISATCPGLGQTVTANGRTDSVLWGPYVAMETGWACDPVVRFAGSSGGALTALLDHLLAAGTVDAVLQTGADPTFPIGNITVISDHKSSVIEAAGSRYAPSAPLADLAKWQADGRRFAFVGKPCDVAALRALMRRDAAFARTFPVVLSFFCAGVPSHKGGNAVLAALGTGLDQTLTFRFRGNGWPGQATAIAKNGTSRSMSYHDSWGGILSKYVQHRCKICADGTGVAADIVCADAWETDAQGYPLFADAPGVSLIVARTQQGAAIIAAARAAGLIETAPFNIAHLARIQPGQRERRRALWARLAALHVLRQPVPVYRGLHLWSAARQNPLTRNFKNFLGTLRRALRTWV